VRADNPSDHPAIVLDTIKLKKRGIKMDIFHSIATVIWTIKSCLLGFGLVWAAILTLSVSSLTVFLVGAVSVAGLFGIVWMIWIDLDSKRAERGRQIRATLSANRHRQLSLF
jgi:hypothetical protein